MLNKIIASVKSNILNAEVVVLESNNKESDGKGFDLIIKLFFSYKKFFECFIVKI